MLIFTKQCSKLFLTFKSVHPYYVATKMSKIKKASWFAPDPNYYARSALNMVGIEMETVGCLSHAIQVKPHKAA